MSGIGIVDSPVWWRDGISVVESGMNGAFALVSTRWVAWSMLSVAVVELKWMHRSDTTTIGICIRIDVQYEWTFTSTGCTYTSVTFPPSMDRPTNRTGIGIKLQNAVGHRKSVHHARTQTHISPTNGQTNSHGKDILNKLYVLETDIPK